MSLPARSAAPPLSMMRNLFFPQRWPLQVKIVYGAISSILVETVLALIAFTQFGQMNDAGLPVDNGQPPLIVILWLAGVISTIGVWYALFLGAVRPLREMVNALELIGLGNYTNPLHARTHDLVGELAERIDALRLEIAQIDADSRQAVERRVQILSGAIAIGQNLAKVQDADQVLQTGVEALCSAFAQIDVARVYTPNSLGTEVIPTAIAGLGNNDTDHAAVPVSLLTANPVSQVFASRHGTVSRQQETPADGFQIDAAPLTKGIRSRCLLPLLISDQVAGILEILSTHEGAFATSDLPLFQSVADQIAGALQNAELFEDLQIRLQEVDLLNRQQTGRNWRDYALNRRFAQADDAEAASDTAAAIMEQSSVWQQAIVRNEFVSQVEGNQVRFAVPIQLSNTVLGAAEWVIAREQYTPLTRQLAESLTGRLALVADNIRLLEQSRAQTSREQLLNNISTRLMQQVDIEQILQTAVQELGQALQVSQAVIRLDDKLSRT